MSTGQIPLEPVSRIEPFILRSPSPEIASLLMRISTGATLLGKALHPATATQLADAVRIMNSYYSNLIEGHKTRPREIEQALNGQLSANTEQRNLQLEAKAHVRLQAMIDAHHASGDLPNATSANFILWLHREFFRGMPPEFLHLEGVPIVPGAWRAELPEMAVGYHLPPSFYRVPEFMAYFQSQYASVRNLEAERVLAIPAAHHRFNYIHPFRDGNGRVSRLMSHAMMLQTGLGAHGLWSISRGLARGLKSREEYKAMMDSADTPRQGDTDGRGNLSTRSLREFTRWFLEVCVDQIDYMSRMFEFQSLSERLRDLVERDDALPDASAPLLKAVLREGEIERGDAPRILMTSERAARRYLQILANQGLLGSATPKGKLSLRFPQRYLERLFPKLYD